MVYHGFMDDIQNGDFFGIELPIEASKTLLLTVAAEAAA
jgi:hypothetical protein